MLIMKSQSISQRNLKHCENSTLENRLISLRALWIHSHGIQVEERLKWCFSSQMTASSFLKRQNAMKLNSLDQVFINIISIIFLKAFSIVTLALLLKFWVRSKLKSTIKQRELSVKSTFSFKRILDMVLKMNLKLQFTTLKDLKRIDTSLILKKACSKIQISL